MPHPATVPKMSDATLTRLIRPTGNTCVDHIMRSCRIRLLCLKCRMQRWRALSDLRGTHVLITSCVYVASGYCAQNVGCGADASYPTYGERMCWSHHAFMSHPATVPKMSDATLTRLIQPTGRMCRPDKAFTPHPAIVSKCNRFYPFWTSPAPQRAAAITPCPRDNPPSPAGKLCGKSNVKSAR